MKIGIGAAGAVIVLAGVVAMSIMSGGGDPKTSAIVASAGGGPAAAAAAADPPGVPATQPAATTPTTKAQASTANASGAKASTARSAPVTLPPNPTAADVQRVIAGITSELLAPANPTASTTPVTKEQVEAQMREQLRQLGINLNQESRSPKGENGMRKIIALGFASLSAATMMFGSVGPAGAVDPATLTDQVCAALPAQVTALSGQLTAVLTGITSSTADLDAKKAALDVAVGEMADAVVAHIEAYEADGDIVASGAALGEALSNFAAKLTAADNAATAWFEAQRGAYLTEVAQGYVADVQTQLCAAS